MSEVDRSRPDSSMTGLMTWGAHGISDGQLGSCTVAADHDVSMPTGRSLS